MNITTMREIKRGDYNTRYKINSNAIWMKT